MIYKWYKVKLEYSPKDYKGNGTVATLIFDHIFRDIRFTKSLTRGDYSSYKLNPGREVKRHFEHIKRAKKPNKEVLTHVEKTEKIFRKCGYEPPTRFNPLQSVNIEIARRIQKRNEMLPKQGLGFTEFNAWVNDLTDTKGTSLQYDPYDPLDQMIGMTVVLNGTKCRIQRQPLNVGGRWRVTLVLYTDRPEGFINYSLNKVRPTLRNRLANSNISTDKDIRK